MEKKLHFTLNGLPLEHTGELPNVTTKLDECFTVVVGNQPIEVFAYPDGRLSDGHSLDGVEVAIETERQRIVKERFGNSVQGTSGLSGKQYTMKAPMP
jgi:hypothetical protein